MLCTCPVEDTVLFPGEGICLDIDTKQLREPEVILGTFGLH